MEKEGVLSLTKSLFPNTVAYRLHENLYQTSWRVKFPPRRNNEADVSRVSASSQRMAKG